MDILEKEKISSINPGHYTGKTCKSAVSIHAVEIEKELPAQISIENKCRRDIIKIWIKKSARQH